MTVPTAGHPAPVTPGGRPFRLLWLSIAAALVTISLKTAAWLLTGSVGLLSDAAESLVNLVAAVIALAALTWASKPADEEHAFGHTKAEYLSAGAEGMMIFVAAVGIAVTAVDRLRHPQPVDAIGVGLVVSTAASLVNLSVGVLLVRAGRRYRSLVLEADGRHLMTDVWTSAGVIVAVTVVAFTGWRILDPLIALAVAVNIVYSGISLLRRSIGGLMDRAVPADEQALIQQVLDARQSANVQFTDVRTRQAGQQAFVSLTVHVPGDWSVQRGHALADQVEQDLTRALPHVIVSTHLEPLTDPVDAYQRPSTASP